MTKQQLEEKTKLAITQTAQALQMVYEALNKGQQKKLLSNDAVAALFARYDVEISV